MNTDYKEEKKQFKRAKKGAWAIIPKQVWIECSHSQLCVYAAISYLQGSNDYTWAGMDIISKESGYSVSACDKIIRELIKLGWIGRIKQYGKPSKLFVYMDYMATEETKKEILEAKKKAKLEFTAKMKELKERKKLTNLQNQNETNLQNQNETNLQNLSGSIYQQQLPTTITNKKVGEEKKSNMNNHEEKEIEQSTKDFPPSPVYSSEQLLGKSNEFIQKIGFGFTRNPRHILDAIYKQLPPDYQVKEDPKDVELIANAIKQYDSAPPSDRDALAKRLYQTVENMAKLYLIKKHGEEFRDKLPVDLHNRNLVIYIGANPTFKYCHSGWSNEIDAIYGEISRVIRKRQEKERAEHEKDRAKVIERERAKSVVLNQPHYTEEQLHDMGYRTVPDILESMRQRSQGDNLDHLDAVYEPIVQNVTDADRKRCAELYMKKINGTITIDEDSEWFTLDRKLKGK